MKEPYDFKKGDKFILKENKLFLTKGTVVEFWDDFQHSFANTLRFYRVVNCHFLLVELCLHDIKEFTDDINNPYVGMELINKQGEIRTVLGVCGLVAHLSYTDGPNVHWNTITIKEIKQIFTTKPTTQKKTISKREIFERLGLDLDGLEIVE